MEPENWELEDWFPFSNGSSWGFMLSRVVYIQSGRNEWSRKPMKIWPALVASSWKAASSSSQACNLHCCSGYNISNSRSWPYYCLPSKRGGSRIKGLYFLDSSSKKEREREGVERNPSPLYEVQWSMISYNWGGLEGQGSVESVVHIEPICNTHFNQTCGPAKARKKRKKLLNSIDVHQYLSLSMVRITHQLCTIQMSHISPYPSTRISLRDSCLRIFKSTPWRFKKEFHPNQPLKISAKMLPSRGLTYPTLGKGKSSSKCHFWGIC